MNRDSKTLVVIGWLMIAVWLFIAWRLVVTLSAMGGV